MPSAVESDISFTVRMQMREHILAWISRDVGLREFLIPELLTDSWTQEQRQAWTNHIIDKYLHTNSKDGKSSRRRILTCETAGSLRRHCVRLRQRTANYRDILKTSVSLESLWNDVSPDLDDGTWASCSRLFDVALASLRVSYVWMYIKAEASTPEVGEEARKLLFAQLIETYFVAEAPTDDNQDKHSANFKDLLTAWRKELLVMMESENFDATLRTLEEANSLGETAVRVETFLGGVDVDNSWVLRMRMLEKEVAKGKLVPKPSISKPAAITRGQPSQARRRRLRRKPPVSRKQGPDIRIKASLHAGPDVEPSDAIEEPAASPVESDSSSEPAAPDSDFEIEAAENAESNDADDSEDNVDVEQQQDIQRVSTRHRQVSIRNRVSSLRNHNQAVPPGRVAKKESNLEMKAGGNGMGSASAVKEDDTAAMNPQASSVPEDFAPQPVKRRGGEGSGAGSNRLADMQSKALASKSPSGVVGDQENLFDTEQETGDLVEAAAIVESRESRRRRLEAALEADESQGQVPPVDSTGQDMV